MQERELVPFHLASFKWNETIRRVWSSDLDGKLEVVVKALDAFVLCFMP